MTKVTSPLVPLEAAANWWHPMLLKADFHIHTREDPHDFIRYTAVELLAEAARQGFEVLALTCHNKRIHNEDLRRRAEDLGILLIPGVEAAIEGKHTLLLDMPYTRLRVRNFKHVRALKRDGGLVIAPHPFFPAPKCLNGKGAGTWTCSTPSSSRTSIRAPSTSTARRWPTRGRWTSRWWGLPTATASGSSGCGTPVVDADEKSLGGGLRRHPGRPRARRHRAFAAVPARPRRLGARRPPCFGPLRPLLLPSVGDSEAQSHAVGARRSVTIGGGARSPCRA